MKCTSKQPRPRTEGIPLRVLLHASIDKILERAHGMAMASTVSVSTAPLHGYQVVFSPYTPHKLAFTGSQNYGIAGMTVIMFDLIINRIYYFVAMIKGSES